MSLHFHVDPDPPEPVDPDSDDPPMPEEDTRGVVIGEIVPEPMALINVTSVLQRMEGITANDRALAVVLGQQALALVSIDTDEDELIAGDLIDRLATHQEHIGRKVRPFADLAFKLHRGLTGFLGQATQELAAGLAHLKPMLAQRLKAKKDAEEARQREEQARARKAEQDRLLAEAAHAESMGESRETVAQIVREAESVPAPPVVARPITQVQGAGTRDNWKCELVDIRQVILHVAERLKAGDASLVNLIGLNVVAATQLARAQKSTMNIPGLRAVNDVAFTKRRA